MLVGVGVDGTTPTAGSSPRGPIEREVIAAAEGAGLLVLARDGDRARLGPRSLGPASRFVADHAPCRSLLVWPEPAPGIATIPPRLLIRRTTGRAQVSGRAHRLAAPRGRRRQTSGGIGTTARTAQQVLGATATRVRLPHGDNEACGVGFRVECM